MNANWFEQLFAETPATYTAFKLAEAEEAINAALVEFMQNLPYAAKVGYQNHLKSSTRRYRVRFDRFDGGRRVRKEGK